MNITRNPQRATLLLDQIRDSFTKDSLERNKTLHLSDLTKPRQAYWQRVLPIPATDAECLYFLAGRGHEDALGRVAGLLVVTDQREKDGIQYRPDFTLFDVPAEFKTRRANLAADGEELTVYENYLEQLRGYCSMEETTSGVLIVLSLLEGRSSDPKTPTQPMLAVYDVTFTSEELAAERTLLGERRDQLTAALHAANESELPFASGAHKNLALCKAWMCSKRTKIVEQPAYCEECDQEFKTELGAVRHKHSVRPAVVRWEATPRCKWFHVCAPWEVDPSRGPQ